MFSELLQVETRVMVLAVTQAIQKLEVTTHEKVPVVSLAGTQMNQ